MTFEKLKSYLYFVFGAFVRTESDGLSLYGSPPFEILPLKLRLQNFTFHNPSLRNLVFQNHAFQNFAFNF